MALVIRLRKLGAKHKPFFRIAVTETTAARDGRFLEEIGWYDPQKEGVNFKVDAERVQHWLSKGAKPSERVASILKRHSQLGKAAAAPAAPAAAEPKVEAEAPTPEPEPTPPAEEPAQQPAEGPAEGPAEEPKTDEQEPTPEASPEAPEPPETEKQ